MRNAKQELPPTNADERELASLKARAATTAERITTARSALVAAQARQAELLASEMFDGDKLGQANMRTMQAQSVVDGLAQLADATAKSITDLEAKLAKDRDQAEREAEAAVLNGVAAMIEGATADFTASAEVLFDVLSGKASPRTIHSGKQYASVLRDTAAGVVGRVGDIVRDLGEAKRAIIEGRSAIPRPEAVAPPPPKPVLARDRVYCFERAVTWNEDGRQQVLQRYTLGMLPTELARYALAAGLVGVPDSPRVAAIQKGIALAVGPPAKAALDLDAAMAAEKSRTMRVPADAVDVG